MITDILKDYWLSEKEAQVYITALWLGSAPASSIARKIQENRVTVYSILKKFVHEWLAHTMTKKNTTFYHVISPDDLLKNLEIKYEKFKEKLPELNAIANLGWNKPRVQFFEGLEWLKTVFSSIMQSSDIMGDIPYRTFVGAGSIDQRFQQYLDTDFKKIRQDVKRPTQAIIAESASSYAKHNKEYDHIIIQKDYFILENEIVLYANNKVAIILYWSEELSAIIIESKTLYKALNSMFDLIRNTHKK